MTQTDGRTVFLSAALDLPDGYGTGRYSADPYLHLARLAERGGLDFVTLGDTFAGPGTDALGTLARLAPETRHLGLVPTVTTTHTEPFHVSSALATLDWASRGRAGWAVDVSRTEAEAALFGRKPAAPAGELWREAGEVADVVARLWDSWEDGAEIRDEPTGRFIDRDKLHYVDFAGEHFSVRGPAIVPRPPQGRPVVVVDATEPEPRGTVVRYADVALVRADDPVTARALREELRARRPGLIVLASLPVELDVSGDAVGLADLIADWTAENAADGFHLRPADPGDVLAQLTGVTVPLLRKRGLRPAPYRSGSTLRAHLGLDRPASRYALTGEERSAS